MGTTRAAGAAAASVRTLRAEATRARILDSAARCFARSGFRRTRFDEVAAGAGVSRALVYTYFESKEDLLRSVCQRALAGWRAAVEPAFRREPDATGALRAMVATTLRYARSRPILRALLGDDERVVILGGDELARRAIDAWRARLVEILERGVASGEFRADLDVSSTADVLRAMQLGLIDRMHRPGGPVDVRSEAHVDAAVELLLGGIRRPKEVERA